jgi:hypothetical protein
MYASGAQHQNNIQLFLSISNQTLDTSENIYKMHGSISLRLSFKMKIILFIITNILFV